MSKQEQVLVSVVIPTFNRAQTLPRAIKSVLNQDYGNLELIIIDDASTDDTETVVGQMKDSRIRYLRHERNQGGGAARNTGIEAAIGELVAFQDSDDEWLDGKLSKQVAALNEAGPECVLVYCTKIIYGRDARFKRGRRQVVCMPGPDVTKLSGRLHETLWRSNVIGTPQMIVRMDALRQIEGFDSRLHNSQDWDLVLRLSKLGTVEFIDEPLINTYIQPDSISKLSRKIPYGHLIIINKHKRQGMPIHVQADRLAWVGYCLGQFGYPSRGNILIRASLAIHLFNLKTWVRFAINNLRLLRRFGWKDPR